MKTKKAAALNKNSEELRDNPLEEKESPILAAKEPQWTNKSHNTLLIQVKHVGIDGFIPMVVALESSLGYNSQLYNDSVAGIYGSIALSDEEQMISGDKPLPEGYIVREGEIIESPNAKRRKELLQKLNRIDQESGAGRAVRKTAVDMGGMLTVLRKVTMDFGDMAKALGVEGFDPDENVALHTLIEYNPEQHFDLQKLEEYENQAADIRQELKGLGDID